MTSSVIRFPLSALPHRLTLWDGNNIAERRRVCASVRPQETASLESGWEERAMPSPAPNCPVRQTLTLCRMCGQIFDADHNSEVVHHRHGDGGETPLPPDTRASVAIPPSSKRERIACAARRLSYGPLPASCMACAPTLRLETLRLGAFALRQPSRLRKVSFGEVAA
jgi:hypothetical protein